MKWCWLLSHNIAKYYWPQLLFYTISYNSIWILKISAERRMIFTIGSEWYELNFVNRYQGTEHCYQFIFLFFFVSWLRCVLFWEKTHFWALVFWNTLSYSFSLCHSSFSLLTDSFQNVQIFNQNLKIFNYLIMAISGVILFSVAVEIIRG